MGFERTELPSGVRVVSERMPAQRSVAVGAWIGVGSRHEPSDLGGVTHFLEHLLFKGTPTRSALHIAETFDAIGGELNAFTTKEYTCFHARVLAEDLRMSVSTIADMMRNASLTSDDVESERSVVLEEIAMHEDTPDDIVFDVFLESLWPEHALGRRVQGTREVIETLARDGIEGWYRGCYNAPGPNLVVAAAGDVEHGALVDLVASTFDARAGNGARPADPAPRPSPALILEQRDTEQAHVVWGTTGLSRDDDRRWALGVLNMALGGGMSSRLFQEIRERRGLAYNVSSGHQGFRDTGVFNVYAGCAPDNVAEVLRIARDHVATLAADGITEAERARAVGHLRGTLLLSLDDPGALMTHFGKSELCQREILSPDEMMRRIEGVTLEDARTVGREVLGRPWSLTVLGPAAGDDLSAFVGALA